MPVEGSGLARSPLARAPQSPDGELVDPNVFETANAGFAQAMYEEFLRDPAAVGPEWRRLFESGVVGEKPSPNGQAVGRPGGQAVAGIPSQPESSSASSAGAESESAARPAARPPAVPSGA